MRNVNIESSRLLIRNFLLDDARDLYEILGNDDVMNKG